MCGVGYFQLLGTASGMKIPQMHNIYVTSDHSLHMKVSFLYSYESLRTGSLEVTEHYSGLAVLVHGTRDVLKRPPKKRHSFRYIGLKVRVVEVVRMICSLGS